MYELTDFVGSSYSQAMDVSYRPVNRQEAYDLWLDGYTIIFSESSNIDDSRSCISMSKTTFHRLGYDSRDFSFVDVISMMRQKISESIGPGFNIHMAVVI